VSVPLVALPVSSRGRGVSLIVPARLAACAAPAKNVSKRGSAAGSAPHLRGPLQPERAGGLRSPAGQGPDKRRLPANGRTSNLTCLRTGGWSTCMLTRDADPCPVSQASLQLRKAVHHGDFHPCRTASSKRDVG